MSAVLGSLIAVIGTLLGSFSTYLFQGRTAQRAQIGLNYSDHAAQTGRPILFTRSLGGPYDDVRIPRGTTKTVVRPR